MLKKITIILILLILISAIGFGIYKFVIKSDSQIENQVNVNVNENQNQNQNQNANQKQNQNININMNNYNARIDISYTGKEGNDITVLKKTPSDMQEVMFDNPDWKKTPGTFKTYLFIAKPEWQKGEIQVKSLGDGFLNISFFGQFKPDENGKPQKVLIDYRNVSVNDETVFKDTKTLWHDVREGKSIQSSDGEIITIKFEYRMPDEK